MIKRVYVDRRKMPLRVYVTFTDGTAYKGKGKTVKLAVRSAIERAKKEKHMPIERCVGCKHFQARSGCNHPDEKKKEFAAIPIKECYEEGTKEEIAEYGK